MTSFIFNFWGGVNSSSLQRVEKANSDETQVLIKFNFMDELKKFNSGEIKLKKVEHPQYDPPVDEKLQEFLKVREKIMNNKPILVPIDPIPVQKEETLEEKIIRLEKEISDLREFIRNNITN